MRISKNFWLKELTGSSMADRLGIDNNPDEDQLVSLVMLVSNILQPVREKFGVVSVSSGLRTKSLNEAIKGSSKSSHCYGEAADFECYSTDNLAIAQWIESNLTFDQLILEFYISGKPSSGWVHCSYKRDGNNRQDVLTASKVDGSVKYIKGLDGKV